MAKRARPEKPQAKTGMTQYEERRIRTFEHRFLVPAWNETALQQTIEFWREQGIRLRQGEAGTLIGKRGSSMAYFLSSNMRKFLTTLSVTIFFADTPFTGDEVRCVFTINSLMQALTDEQLIWWPVELKTFESCLLAENDYSGQWKRIVKRRWRKLAGTTPEVRQLKTKLRSDKDELCPPLF